MKQLITDQLIEEYKKELELIQSLQFHDKSVQYLILATKEDLINSLLSRLQSLQQQEMHNVMTAYRDGDVLRHLYNDSEDYFNQTFKQPDK